MIYTSCRYAPEELMAGFQETCQRLDPSPEGFECADSCSHPNMCSYAKAVIEEIRRLSAECVILTDCCDATRRVYDVLKASGTVRFLYLLPLPHKNGEAELKLFEQELIRLKDAYQEYSGKPFQVSEAVNAYQKQQKNPRKEPSGSFLRLIGAHGGRVLKEEIGEVFPDIELIDDTCTGNRYLRREAESEASFFHWYAYALLNQDQACMRMCYRGGKNPEYQKRPAGEIFHTIKFCDYYSFEYMEEKKNPDLPILKIETDTTRQNSGQLKTRLEAFREELGMSQISSIRVSDPDRVYVAGIDSGSASTDAVVMDRNRRILGRAILPTGAGAASGAEKALEQALREAGIRKEELSAIVTTGYGRETIGVGSASVTEITCHARGAHFLDPDARTVIDIGGQDSKVIRIDENGSVKNFVMNDKCAAGTGRFLEMQARALGLSLAEMSELGLSWKNEVTISSMCTVFAESEVVSLVAQNVPAADIIHGLNRSVASRTALLGGRIGMEPAFIMTGGVAQNAGVVACLEEKLGEKIFVSPDSQLCGSIGAALIALEQVGVHADNR
ncbi:acyl-CoA dehydratase activase [Anaerolactibacter massiliensis]|uniref:acyl-CoA dehydratase activase n=1 Tax=Anaerolactibacter massiliensis TaxID=2044573 RepID=UPI000CF9ECC5|nr:acyl-CoA dehydratase activase [Anaerolactibacter massiliensis]